MRCLLSSIKAGLITFVLVSLLGRELFAHRPIFTADAAASPETAIRITNPDISQVIYREITQHTPQVWLTFTAPKDFELFIQIGVPVIDRLKDFRPSMALIGPGLPADAAPFPLPQGLGAKVFSTKEVEKPRFFHEHFTSTHSWILRSETVRLPSAGRYYLVAFSLGNQTGKLWLSLGKRESFSLDDLKQFPAWRKRIQEFHEVKKN